jgi:hypothetical protein
MCRKRTIFIRGRKYLLLGGYNKSKRFIYYLYLNSYIYLLQNKSCKMKNNTSVTAQDSLEKVMQLSDSCTCNRGLSCCRVTPVILDDELKKIEGYIQEKFGISRQEMQSEYLQQVQYLGRELVSPKTADGKCVFFKEMPAGTEKKRRGLFRASCISALPHDKVGSCSINEVKPLLCKIYSCGVRNITEWFEFNYIARGYPHSEQLFREKMANDRYAFLPGLD